MKVPPAKAVTVGRIVISVAVVIALFLVSTAAPCLACSLSRTPAPRSCCHHGTCDKPGTSPVPQTCQAPDLPVAALDRAAAQITYASLDGHPVPAGGYLSPVLPHRPAPLPRVDVYSPPDLSLLNSVLTV